MTKEEKKLEKLNSQLENLKNYFCDCSIKAKDFEKADFIDDVKYAVFKDLPLSESRLDLLSEKVLLKYHLDDCPVMEYIGIVHDYTNIFPLAKAQFYIKKNDISEAKTRPTVIDFLKYKNTGTYVIIFGINEEKHQYFIKVVNNGRIVMRSYLDQINKMIESKNINQKEFYIKALREMLTYKIEDCIQIVEPDPRVSFYL